MREGPKMDDGRGGPVGWRCLFFPSSFLGSKKTKEKVKDGRGNWGIVVFVICGTIVSSALFCLGVVIGEEVGMRMKVGEWLSSWMCREVGVELKGKKKKNARRRRKRIRRERTNGENLTT